MSKKEWICCLVDCKNTAKHCYHHKEMTTKEKQCNCTLIRLGEAKECTMHDSHCLPEQCKGCYNPHHNHDNKEKLIEAVRQAEQKEGWEERFDHGWEHTEVFDSLTKELVKQFIRSELSNQLKTIGAWAKTHNNDSDLVSTFDLIRFVDDLKEELEKGGAR